MLEKQRERTAGEFFCIAVYDALYVCLNLNPISREEITLMNEAYGVPKKVFRPHKNRSVINWMVRQEYATDLDAKG